MRKIYKCIIKKKKKKLNLFIKARYINILIMILETLWLKCSATQFIFYSYALTEVSLNTH